MNARYLAAGPPPSVRLKKIIDALLYLSREALAARLPDAATAIQEAANTISRSASKPRGLRGKPP